MRLKWIAVALLAGALIACGTAVVNPVSGETEMSAMSEEQEVAEGAKAHQQVLQEYSVYDNPAVQSYVNALGQRLAAQSHRANLQWHFTVLDSPEINAFALPGGYVYVTRGIMAYMESEADLAGVMGHEIGHVTARHGAQRATSQQKAGLGVFAANILGLVLESQGVSGAGQMAGQVSQTVAAGFIASYGREQELQADGLGAEYLARNHYDPHNMVDVIKVLKNQERYAADVAKAEGRPAPSGGGWLASHPSNDQRLEQIRQTADRFGTSASYADEGRDRYLQVIAGLSFGESAEQGVVRERNFYHAGLNIASLVQ
jgi:predicted Zn-dependent protease